MAQIAHDCPVHEKNVEKPKQQLVRLASEISSGSHMMNFHHLCQECLAREGLLFPQFMAHEAGHLRT